jgi:hypothetical protein
MNLSCRYRIIIELVQRVNISNGEDFFADDPAEEIFLYITARLLRAFMFAH